ncbi:hypothetical protein HDV03_000734 [Kappamyces sp. JEL0829]|nr:hypothetical protein HDV03_000734 [Kappamyces sp. JEL0829]KAJ3363114.1 hypothetical protein HDU91_003104 [Kappamyces sp. JEL0680]
MNLRDVLNNDPPTPTVKARLQVPQPIYPAVHTNPSHIHAQALRGIPSHQPAHNPAMKPCLWQRPFCTMTFADDQALYDHVNEVHIGRKKTDNLCLSCHWKNCAVVCSKRDHITSHIKVHIPVKPYKCLKCTRSFKRAQDLTKHSRSHEEPQMARSLMHHPTAPLDSVSSIISTAISTPRSETTRTPESTNSWNEDRDAYPAREGEGYFSDPGISDATLLASLSRQDLWESKNLSKKRKSLVIDTATVNHIKIRRLEKSVHLT